MSVDYTLDYSDHVLLENKNRYKELYKLLPTDASNVSKGDLILLKTISGRYGLFMALSNSSVDGELKLTPFSEVNFIKYDDQI